MTSGHDAVAEAFAPMALAVVLDDEVDASRGNVLAHVHNVPGLVHELEAMIVWMSERPLETGKEYLLKQTTTTVPCQVTDLRYRIDVQELRRCAAASLGQNDIGRVRIETAKPVAVDPYSVNRSMGSFILIDRMTDETAGAGMILDRDTAQDLPPSQRSRAGRVTVAERARRLGHSPLLLWIVDEHGTIAHALERRLFDRGYFALAIARSDILANGGADLLRSGMIVIIGATQRLSEMAAEEWLNEETPVVEVNVIEADASLPDVRNGSICKTLTIRRSAGLDQEIAEEICNELTRDGILGRR